MSGTVGRWAVTVAIFGLAAAGCGKADPDSGRHEEARHEKGTDASAPAGAPNEADMEKMAADAQKAYREMNGGKEVKAVAPEDLKKLLPAEIAGAKRGGVEAQHVNQMGMDISTAKADYQPVTDPNDDGSHPKPSFNVTITDIGNLSGTMAMGYAAWSTMTFEKTTDTGYEKTVKIHGFPGQEQYDNESKSGTVHVLVTKRFVVEVRGNDASIEQIRGALDAIDVSKVEALAK